VCRGRYVRRRIKTRRMRKNNDAVDVRTVRIYEMRRRIALE
jgi:hypothetical protein